MNYRIDHQIYILFLMASLVCASAVFYPPCPACAIQPGAEQGVEKGTVPGIPAQRPERPIAPSDRESRKIVEQPVMQVQKRWADTYLPKSVWHVIDPQDGLSKDGRVAVLEGLEARVVYQFYPQHRVLNVPNQPDLTIYTYDKSGFEGPYNVFVANFGASNWTPLGNDVTGTRAFDLPPNLESIELVLITSRQKGAVYIEAVEGITPASGATQGTMGYIPETITGIRAERVDCHEVERARAMLAGGGMSYQLAPLGEIEIQWKLPIQNQWKVEEFSIEAEGQYEVYASDSQGMENFIGRRAGKQNIDLPQNMADVSRVRIRNHNDNRPVVIYSIVGRR